MNHQALHLRRAPCTANAAGALRAVSARTHRPGLLVFESCAAPLFLPSTRTRTSPVEKL